ncbi:hypothetical protein [Candidatus Clavichlamydia salmonicola]|uniref:hypothetical protein n=1 Tax=Candidatus Clavichlamydia salmonicola TaxID=469812 RepID=UPI0018914A23|nr:hypothetical protein [Candidatus Clavichlamydia salmonicola]
MIFIISKLIDLLTDENFREKLKDQETALNLYIGKKRTIMKELVGSSTLKYRKSF